MKDNFIIITNFKKTILFLDKIVINFPNNEKVLKDKIMNTVYEILELLYITNEISDRIFYQKKIISKLKMVDFYLKIACDKKYLSYKKYLKVSNYLLENLKVIYGWVKSEKKI